MFVVHRKGRPRDGAAPTLLYGYGGFNVSLEPAFRLSALCWLLAYDGCYAVANLRGGGEYGREWRNAGERSAAQQERCVRSMHAALWLRNGKYRRGRRCSDTGSGAAAARAEP